MFEDLYNYVNMNIEYIKADELNLMKKAQFHKSDRLSNAFLLSLCFILGVVSHVKLEVVTDPDAELKEDLHTVIFSPDEILYIGDVDLSVVRWNLEVDDLVAVITSCLVIWTSSRWKSPYTEYALLPWLGITLRGLVTRQAISVLASAYVFAVAEENARIVFYTIYSLLFLVEMRLWLDTARLVASRYRRHCISLAQDTLREYEGDVTRADLERDDNSTDCGYVKRFM